MLDQRLSVLFSCPRGRYQVPMELSGPESLNPALEASIRRYRQIAFNEHRQVQTWVMSQLEQRQRLLQQRQPHATDEERLILAREQLQREYAIRFRLSPIGSLIVLAVGVATSSGFYYVNFDAFPIPHQPLSPEQAEQTWHHLRELHNSFFSVKVDLAAEFKTD